jgi:hypothetical protein
MNGIIAWLLDGDPSVAYLSATDLLGEKGTKYLSRIGKRGWCADYMAARNPDGSWGGGFYMHKWISTHYTLLELRNLRYRKTDPSVRKEIERVSREERGFVKGVKKKATALGDDVCVAGMYLNYAAYFGAGQDCLVPIVDYILGAEMEDGGYNCAWERGKPTHSSLHTSLSVIEGFDSYLKEGYPYRSAEMRKSIKKCSEFILKHKLFRSTKTDEVIDQKFLRMTYPFRWKYTIVRALNCFADLGIAYDRRMDPALALIAGKKTKGGAWKLQSGFPGQVHFKMEEAGKPSRMMTYLCLKISNAYGGAGHGGGRA